MTCVTSADGTSIAYDLVVTYDRAVPR